MREGKEQRINSLEVVPEDIIILSNEINLADPNDERFKELLENGNPLPFIGETIPSDARLLESKDLYVIETYLSGASSPSKKDASIDILPENTELDRIENMVFAFTTISKGYGRAIVITTGKNTEVGKISIPL